MIETYAIFLYDRMFKMFFFNQVQDNCNAPRAVTYAAMIYSLRCLVKHDIPLNQVNEEGVAG